MASSAADLVTAGQCWHWFDQPRAIAEVIRLLKPGGQLVIANFDWLPLAGNVVEANRFDTDLVALLSTRFPSSVLAVPHRVFAIVAQSVGR